MLGEEIFIEFTSAVTKWASHSLSPKMPLPLKSWKGVVLTHQEGRGDKASSLSAGAESQPSARAAAAGELLYTSAAGDDGNPPDGPFKQEIYSKQKI